MSETGEPKVAVVGATGAVGNQLLDLIAARSFAPSGLRLFATAKGAGETVAVGDEELLVANLESPAALAEFDIAFLAVPAICAAEIISANPGPKLIDLSAAARAPSPEAPMVSPGLTARDRIAKLSALGVFAIPHPVAHVLATCLKALEIPAGMVAATAMLGASSGGKGLVARTVEQTTDLLSARLDLEEDETQRGFNLFMREHERSIAGAATAQVAAMLSPAPELRLQTVSVPVLYGSAITIEIPADGGGEVMIELIRGAPGVLLTEEGEPLSVIDAVGQEAILVQAEPRPHGLSLWCVFDNVRLAALTALWIAETLSLRTPPLA
ncbi:MAG TPA: hypothetical protein VIX59_04695 [Candidatus Binataceae bacterium]